MKLEEQVASLVALVKSQTKEIDLLRSRVKVLENENKELRRGIKQDSNNSSKPPSSDSIFKRSDRPVKKKQSTGKRGGQHGHKGHKLKKFVEVDHRIDHTVQSCPSCHSVELHLLKRRARQILDIPIPKVEVTEHILYDYQCGCCGQHISSQMGKELKQEVQYGPAIKAVVNYLNVYQLIPYKRLTEIIEQINGHRISQGSISNFNKEMNDKLSGFVDQTKTTFLHPDQVLHTDETGCMVSKVLHWVHVYSDKTRTLLQGHSKRGRKAMDDIGIIQNAKGTLIHDRFRSYQSYDHLDHGLCNAHLLREMKAIVENEQLSWVIAIKKILLRAKHFKDKMDIPLKRAQNYQSKYEKILRLQRPYYQEKDKQLRLKKPKGPLKRSADHKLFLALWKHRNEVLKFMFDVNVPFDNNQAERDLRMLKVKMKISNQFLTQVWLNVHATIRSFISTAQKQNREILQCLIQTHKNPHFAIQLAV